MFGEDSDTSDGCRSPVKIFIKSEDSEDNPLPVKSREKYTAMYTSFLEWREKNNMTSFAENVLMAYFKDKSSELKPSTMWSQYSMLRSTLNMHHNIDISTYTKLLAFLKNLSHGFRSKRSSILTAEEVERFLTQAPDEKYLATKVALIFGITGACRSEELVNIRLRDIETHGQLLLVKVANSNSIFLRSFTISGFLYKIVKKYALLRPPNTPTDRFFLNYQKGKCTIQVIGRNKFGSMPKQIAEYLNLPDPKSFTGHSFRRTSAALFADAGGDISTVKRNVRSNKVSNECAEDKNGVKRRFLDQISTSIVLASTSKKPEEDDIIEEKRIKLEHYEVELDPLTVETCDI